MMSITGVVVASAMGTIVMAPMFQLTVAQAQSRAQLEARVLWQSEVERARRLWSLDTEDFDLVQLSNQSKCVTGQEHSYVDDGFMFDVECTVGGQTVGKNTVLLPYPPQSGGFSGPYFDKDGDGFEDTTGMPTHYYQCYNGWKTNGFNETKNGCELGGQYVIPMYRDLYSNGQPV